MPANDGFINIIKPTGMTSNDLVAKLRGIIRKGYGEKVKVGHTGTLDPNAAGVMLVAIGKATKFTKYIIEKDKTYIAEITFGKKTDTLDSYGEVVEEKMPKRHSEEEIKEVLENFMGKSLQIPPKFSALKIDGQRLYKLAREGKEVPEIQPREIEIHKIKLLDRQEDRVTISVTCSSGTYIRSLASDIGEALGEFATLTMLIRTDVDGHAIQESFTMEELEEKILQKRIQQVLIPTEEILQKFPKLLLKDGVKLYVNGAKIRTARYVGKTVSPMRYRVYAEKDFLGIGMVSREDDLYLKSETLN
ncbi:MAG: tRNA pseudouridine(55) synthase TruB [Peptostreptococcaceae bacterium]|nr:tRNA pseudouridine(55) synthase TruB [Peptostreptococcaceae bacterium]